MIHSIKRPLAGVVALSGLVLAFLLTTAEPARAAVGVEPSEAFPGDEVTVSGDAGLLDLQVRLCWDQSGCSNLGTVNVIVDKSYSTTVTIPSNADPGEHTIYACGTLSGCDSTLITVLDDTPPTTTTTLPPVTTTTTVPTTTTTSPPTTTTTTSTPTTTDPPGTTTAPGPTTTPSNPTTSPGPTTTSPNPTTTQPSNTIETPETTYQPPSTTGPGETSTGEDDEPEDEVLGVTIENDDPEDPTSQGRGLVPLAATPPTIYTPPTFPSERQGSEPETTRPPSPEAQAAGNEDVTTEDSSSPWTFDKPIVYWAAWVLLMVVVLGLVTAWQWAVGRRRKQQTGTG